MLKWLAQTFYDFPADARREGPQLVTISYSHYNELSRWSLERGGVTFTEHGYAPGQHILPALSIRVPSSGARHLSTSSSMTGSKPSPTSLPALVLPDGTVLKDSWEIAASTALAPIPPALQEVLDRELGVAARKLAYCILLKPQHAGRFAQMCTEGRHWGWRLLWHCGLGAGLRGELEKAFRPKDAAGLEACIAQLDALMAPTGVLAGALASARAAGQPFLGGAALGQADIALCAIAALLVLPEEYGGASRPMAPHFAYLMAKDEQMRPLVERWRRTEVGAFVLDVYKQHRIA
jgi:glutathione S-transferase